MAYIGLEGNSGVVREPKIYICTLVRHYACELQLHILLETLVSFHFTPLLPSNPICHKLSHRECLILVYLYLLICHVCYFIY